MRAETSFDLVGDLIGVDAVLVGPAGRAEVTLILDTAAVMTTMVPSVAEPNGRDMVQGSVRLCIATTGGVTEAKMLVSTGYLAYDQELLAAVRTWRYQPYTLHSKSEVCTNVIFRHRIE